MQLGDVALDLGPVVAADRDGELRGVECGEVLGHLLLLETADGRRCKATVTRTRPWYAARRGTPGHMSLTSTSVAGRYRLETEVGRGGMGVVWSAYDELLHRKVAIKQVRYPAGMAAEERQRLAGRTLREARAVAAIDDPHALRVYDIVEEDGQPWIVMEFVRGHTLTDEIRARGPLPTQEVARIGLGLVDALEAAHRAGLLHRDVKPSNVILGDDGRVRLTDFGIAAVDSDDHDVSSTGLIMGTPGYLAPERARGDQPTAASDYWSLGATLWTAVEGRPPYAGSDAVTTMRRVVSEAAPVCGMCDSRLASVLELLMARDPARRPSPGEIRRGMRPLLAAPPEDVAPVSDDSWLPASFDSSTVLAGPAPVARRTWLAPAVAAAVVLLVAAALIGVVRTGDDTSPARPTAAPPSSERPSASTAADGDTAGGTAGGTTSAARIGRK